MHSRDDSLDAPLIVAIGGTQRNESSSATALRYCLVKAEEMGARTCLLSGSDLSLTIYDPSSPDRSPTALALLEAIRSADGVIVASPGYHGGVSGLIKNALDYLEETASDPAPYLTDRAVGCIATAAGWQAAGSVLAGLRATVHALRGWPTPLGVQLNSAGSLFNSLGQPIDSADASRLTELTRQVITFARKFPRHRPN